MDLSRYPVAAFRDVRPKTAAADKLRWGLEDTIHRVVVSQGLTGVEPAVAQLNRGGHTLAIRQAGDTYREYHGLVADGAVRLSLTVLVSGDFISTVVTLEPTAARLRSPGELAAAAMQDRFFGWYDRVARKRLKAAWQMAPDDRIVLCCGLLLAEVNNGGFGQYFYNTEMVLAEDTLATLWAIDAMEVARLLTRAMEVAAPAHLTGRPLTDALDRMDTEGQRQLRRLDRRFYALSGDLPVVAMAFVSEPAHSA